MVEGIALVIALHNASQVDSAIRSARTREGDMFCKVVKFYEERKACNT